MSLSIAVSKGPDQSTQFDQGVHCLQTESLDTIECVNEEQGLEETLYMCRMM